MSTILLTGASRGLGAAIRAKFEGHGHRCICPTRDEMDLADAASVESYAGALEERIDCLINNAAINIKAELAMITGDNLEEMVSTNLVAPLKLMQGVIGQMAANGGGRVVNIGSIWGLRSREHRTLYSMTKFGLDGMTRALAREFGAENILLNTVAPGFMATEMTYKNLVGSELQKVVDEIPLGRLANPAEIAELVYFLGSSSNTYVTGQTVIADGGFLA